jgi:hypothetical protein
MLLPEWIAWAYEPSATPHRFAAYFQAKQAGRDLGRVVAVAEFREAMSAAGFAEGRTNRHGEVHYLVADSASKRTFDFKRFILADDSVPHPLVPEAASGPCADFEALPIEQQQAILAWIKASLERARKTRTLSELRYPCQIVTGLALRNEHMRGALLTAGIEAAGHRFRCRLSDEALRRFRETKRAEVQRV